MTDADPGDGDAGRNSGRDRTDLPVVDPPETVTGPVDGGRVAGVLLAAGESSRFGEANKLLADVDGEPLVRHAGRTLSAAGLSPRVAVLGHESDRVRGVLDGLGFAFVENPDYEQGQATSVRAGVRAIEDAGEEVAAAVFALGDMPSIAPESIQSLVAAYRAGSGSALAAACKGRRGNPVLFDSQYFDALASVSGDVGGREILLSGDDSALAETGDPGVLRDVDTKRDLDAV